ncbi:hypothetical protein C8J57DRAFT_1673039 [Mycena rebaudengoi]|nr:hypothetical protein C8J57DRAFT_1673039 [Mycena rebaudengoi]
MYNAGGVAIPLSVVFCLQLVRAKRARIGPKRNETRVLIQIRNKAQTQKGVKGRYIDAKSKRWAEWNPEHRPVKGLGIQGPAVTERGGVLPAPRVLRNWSWNVRLIVGERIPSTVIIASACGYVVRHLGQEHPPERSQQEPPRTRTQNANLHNENVDGRPEPTRLGRLPRWDSRPASLLPSSARVLMARDSDHNPTTIACASSPSHDCQHCGEFTYRTTAAEKRWDFLLVGPPENLYLRHQTISTLANDSVRRAPLDLSEIANAGPSENRTGRTLCPTTLCNGYGRASVWRAPLNTPAGIADPAPYPRWPA